MGFAIGDTVCIKSGRALMTVTNLVRQHVPYVLETESDSEPLLLLHFEKYVQPGPTIMRRR